jgi:hypothetical protein
MPLFLIPLFSGKPCTYTHIYIYMYTWTAIFTAHVHFTGDQYLAPGWPKKRFHWLFWYWGTDFGRYFHYLRRILSPFVKHLVAGAAWSAHRVRPALKRGGPQDQDCAARPFWPLWGQKLNAYTFWLFLTIPIAHFRTMKNIGRTNYLKGQKKFQKFLRWSGSWRAPLTFNVDPNPRPW